MKLPKLTCTRCKHIWVPRVEQVITCPNCMSPYWNKPRTYNTKRLRETKVLNDLGKETQNTNEKVLPGPKVL